MFGLRKKERPWGFAPNPTRDKSLDPIIGGWAACAGVMGGGCFSTGVLYIVPTYTARATKNRPIDMQIDLKLHCIL